MTAIALTIAGSDSGGGAGIQADLKTFSAFGVYGASVLTALTAQNTQGVQGIHDVPPEFIGQQMQSVLSDINVAAIKIGMLSQPGIILEIADRLQQNQCCNIVLDPVMVSATGDPLIADESVSVLIEHLFPMATLITPNLPESARILNANIATNEKEQESQAEMLLELSPKGVLLKGGHGSGEQCCDFLLTPNGSRWFRTERVDTKNTHGTGCTLSSAITAGLAQGESLETAVDIAEVYINKAILAADRLKIGSGFGPVHHFHEYWPEA